MFKRLDQTLDFRCHLGFFCYNLLQEKVEASLHRRCVVNVAFACNFIITEDLKVFEVILGTFQRQIFIEDNCRYIIGDKVDFVKSIVWDIDLVLLKKDF